MQSAEMSEPAVYQLLERNQTLFPNGRYLVINAPKGEWLRSFAQQQDVHLLDWMYDAHCQHSSLLADSSRARFAAHPLNESYDQALLFWPKEKALVALMLDYLSALPLSQPLTLWLCGHNTGGIKSAATLLKKAGLQPVKVDSARHCTLFRVQLAPATPRPAAQLLESTKQQFTIAEEQLQLTTYPGVFSAGTLDAGTALLLQHLPELDKHRVLDFGCGSGVISCVLAKRFPALSVLAVDVNAFALQASEDSFANNQLTASSRAVCGVDSLQGERFDLIITNPPFHQGTNTDYDVTEQLIAQAPALLNRGGKLLMVANRFLKYPDRIQQAFGRCTTLAQDNKFSIYLAEK